jgi:hypothetical protein
MQKRLLHVVTWPQARQVIFGFFGESIREVGSTRHPCHDVLSTAQPLSRNSKVDS